MACQKDLCRLRLETARAYASALTSHTTPLTSSRHASLRVAAQVQGLGPLFRLSVTVQNTAPSPSAALTGCYLAFKCDPSLYRLQRQFVQVGGATGALWPWVWQ